MEMVNQLISGAYLNPQIQMLQECRAKQERDKERSVGKSTEVGHNFETKCLIYKNLNYRACTDTIIYLLSTEARQHLFSKKQVKYKQPLEYCFSVC